MSRLNQNPLKEVVFNSFAGGYAGAKGAGSLSPNEALDLDNIILLPGGNGFRNRLGNKELDTNNFTSMSEWDIIVGLGMFKNATNEYLVWAAHSTSDDDIDFFEGVLDSGVSALRVTMTGTFSKNSLITMFNFQDRVIGVGANAAPISIIPGTSGAALAGSPPSGKVGIAWNNRVWIGNTTSNPSKLSYSILNDEEDWTSSGSGFVEPQPGDGDEITAIAPISNNILLLFKNRSIYQVVGRSDPFAVFPLFQSVGCAGNRAVVAAEGLVYFVTPTGEMRITDGNRIYDDRDIATLSHADDLWAQVPKSRLPYVQGFRHQGDSFDHIVWMVSLGASQSTNNYAIIWDLKNKCWLKNSKGFNGNAVCKTSTDRYLIGSYVGARVNELDYAGRFVDDSEGTPTLDGSNRQVAPTDAPPIRWFWRTDDMSLDSLQNIVQVDRINILTEFEANGNLKFAYGYDGYFDSTSAVLPVTPSTFILGTSVLAVDLLGGFRSTTNTVRPLGRGQSFNCKFESNDAVQVEVTKYTLAGRQAATKVKEVR